MIEVQNWTIKIVSAWISSDQEAEMYKIFYINYDLKR